MSINQLNAEFLNLDLIPGFSHEFVTNHAQLTKRIKHRNIVIDRSFLREGKPTGDLASGWWRNFLDNEEKFGLPGQSISDGSYRGNYLHRSLF